MLNGYDDIDYLMNLKNTIKKFSYYLDCDYQEMFPLHDLEYHFHLKPFLSNKYGLIKLDKRFNNVKLPNILLKDLKESTRIP